MQLKAKNVNIPKYMRSYMIKRDQTGLLVPKFIMFIAGQLFLRKSDPKFLNTNVISILINEGFNKSVV